MSDLTKKVEQALAEDELTRDQDISVRVVGAVAFLDGMVDGDDAKDKAEETARGVEGVQLVRNRLQIRKLRSDERRERLR